MHIWGTHVHMYTKNEVSTSNPVPGGVSTDDDDNDTKDDGQSMIVSALWFINQMSEKPYKATF